MVPTRVIALILLMTVAVVELSHRQVSAYVTTDSDADWNAFKIRYDKKYSNSAEETYRRNIRKEKLKVISAHNEEAESGKHTFTMGENEFTDWTNEEFQRMLGLKPELSVERLRDLNYRPPAQLPTYINTVNVTSLPSYVNWTEEGWVGKVMNQGPCGSCWAYSATGSMQSQYYNLTRKMVQLSQQNLIDCSEPEGNNGCRKGSPQSSFWYVQRNGIESLADYRDVSQKTGNGPYYCKFDASLSVTSLQGWHNISPGSEDALQQAVALVGPVSIGFDATNSFLSYSGGIYSNDECHSHYLNHAMLAVGYGVSGNESYWLIQNSWGTSWGIDGYAMVARGSNMCGVASGGTFPVINKLLTTPTPATASTSNTPGSSYQSSNFSPSTAMGWRPVCVLALLVLMGILIG